MRKIDIENMVTELNAIKAFADNNLDYNSSTKINQSLIKVLPILKAEYERLDTNQVEINCPAMELISSEIAEKEGLTVVDYMNRRMQELVENGFKIIDFGLYDKLVSSLGLPTVYEMFIKYTS